MIGKRFPFTLAQQVTAVPEETLLALLARLQVGEFLYEQVAFPESLYSFKHVLTQEVAYNSLLIEQRKVLHERTARAIEANCCREGEVVLRQESETVVKFLRGDGEPQSTGER